MTPLTKGAGPMLSTLFRLAGVTNAICSIGWIFFACTYYVMMNTTSKDPTNEFAQAVGSIIYATLLALASFGFFQAAQCFSRPHSPTTEHGWRRVSYVLIGIGSLDIISIFLTALLPQKRSPDKTIPDDGSSLYMFLHFVQENHATLDAMTNFLTARPYGLFSFALALAIHLHTRKASNNSIRPSRPTPP